MDTSMSDPLKLQKYEQPLHIDTNISYDLDSTLFPGLEDPQQMYQPALLIATDWTDFIHRDDTRDSCNYVSGDITNSSLTTDLHFEDLPDLLPCLDEETFQDLVDDVTTDTDSPPDYFEDINIIKQSPPTNLTLSSSYGEDRGVCMSFPSGSFCDEELSPFSDLLSPFSDELPLLSDELLPLDGEEPVFDDELPYFDDDLLPGAYIEHKQTTLDDFTSALNLQISNMVSSNKSCFADLHPVRGCVEPSWDQ